LVSKLIAGGLLSAGLTMGLVVTRGYGRSECLARLPQ
jgi:hypothetical protein